MDYRDRLNLVFKSGNAPASLRSIFDCYSSQWDRTSLSAKIKVLKPMLESGYTLKDWVSDYTSQYKTTHPHVIGAIYESIKIIYDHSQDHDLNAYLKAWFTETTSISDSITSVITPQLLKDLADKCIKVLPLDSELNEEFYYCNLHFCVIDAVFSIGVKYESVKNVVKRTATYFNQSLYSIERKWPDRDSQVSITAFLELVEDLSVEELAKNVFVNQQRTSSTNGILKAEAVLRYLRVLKSFDINYFQDLENVYDNEAFDRAIKGIKGQGSGITLSYFFMLGGNDNIIKPDRMIIKFLLENTSKVFSMRDAQSVLYETAKLISNSSGKVISARHLDNLIWGYQRSIK